MSRAWRARVATWLLTCALPIAEVEAIVGDLEEEVTTERSGSATWYWSQVLRSFPSLVALRVSRGGWLATAGIVIAACAGQATIELMAAGLAWALGPSQMAWSVPSTLVVTLPAFTWLSYQATRMRAAAGPALAGVAALALTLRLWLVVQSGLAVPVALVAAHAAYATLALTGGFLALKTDVR